MDKKLEQFILDNYDQKILDDEVNFPEVPKDLKKFTYFKDVKGHEGHQLKVSNKKLNWFAKREGLI